MEQQHKTKTRDLSIFEFYEQLQLEYIVLELRKKIYPSLTDKEYYTRVMDQKREKIIDIASKNYLPSIFTDKKIKQHKYNEVYNAFGLPNFFYKDEDHKLKYALLDKKYYYLPGSEVRITIDGEVKVGKIEEVDFIENKAIISCSVQGKYKVNLEYIARVL
jgi:hypothetical protein